MLFSGKGLRVAGAALVAMVLWPATVVANVYQVTRSGTDGEGYTLATAIEAASASGQPATIEIMLFSVLVTETLIIDTPVQIQPGPHLSQADIHARLDGPLFDLRAGAEGSVFSHVGVYGDVPVTMPTSAFSVCANDLTFSGVYVGMFQQAFHLDCAAPLSLTIADSYLLKNGRQLSGELLPGSMIQVQGSILEAPETVVDLQAPECGGAVMIEDSTFGEFFPGLVRDLNVAMVHLRGCLEAEFRSVTATDMGAFLKASPYEAGAGPTVLITNSLIQGAPALTLPIIDFEGQQLTLRHTSLTAGGVDADHPCLRHRDGALLLDHTVIAGNGCQDDVLVEDGTLEASYSLLGRIEAPPATVTLDSVSQQLLGSDPLVASAPAHREPVPGSPLINAGDPSRQPGEGTTPWQDVRGSARLNGSAIDIGAIEFNRRPYMRVDDFYETLRARVKQAGPDDIIAIPLEPYLADPDGHQIIELVLLQVDIPWQGYGEHPYPPPLSSLSMDENTWTLIGKEADFRGFVAVFELTDELGLRNYQALQFDHAWPGGSGSGGYMAPFVLLMIFGLLRQRRGRRPCG